jgi:hypothetical protein
MSVFGGENVRGDSSVGIQCQPSRYVQAHNLFWLVRVKECLKREASWTWRGERVDRHTCNSCEVI